MKSVMSHNFAQVASSAVPRSTFDRSHGHKTTLNSGFLYPILVDEALPGDTFSVNMNAFARLATPIFPVMDNMYMSTFFFAVPLRILWTNFKKMMGEQVNPGDSTDYIIPTVPAPVGGWPVGSLSDYMGIPTDVDGIETSAMWHRGYNAIWNHWFRDENLQSSISVPVNDGPDDPAVYNLKRRGKRHDYFTSCLPWPQKGPSVEIPLGSSAPVMGLGKTDQAYAGSGPVYETGATGTRVFTSYAGPSTTLVTEQDPNNPGFPGIYADLSQATSSTINALRNAFAIQRLLEKDARGGTRYPELILSHFGVVSPDQRQQRPEYLGGGRTMVNISPIAQTSETGTTSPQGNLAGMGTVSATSGHGFTKSFTEHCVIIGLVHIGADLTYQQGLDKMFSRSTRWDFYWPELATVGEQAVLNREIFATGTATDDDVFGYQERFGELRFKQSRITGQFRSTYDESLDAWHLSQEFTNLPTLNSEFIADNPPVQRVVAVQDYPEFLFDSYFNMRCTRPLPTYGIPGLTRL